MVNLNQLKQKLKAVLIVGLKFFNKVQIFFIIEMIEIYLLTFMGVIHRVLFFID